MSQTTIAELLSEFETRLQRNQTREVAILEASILIGKVIDKPHTYLIAWPERVLLPAQLSTARHLLERRLNGEPIAYITGHREFWSLDLEVTRETLIPRPETESLVTRALELLTGTHKPHIVDLGTGSGAIALALAKERPDALIYATDGSLSALQVAQGNAQRLGLTNIHFYLGDWCHALPEGTLFHLFVSNPPYIATDDHHLQEGDLPYEPRSALVSGEDGLDAIREITATASPYLTDNGGILIEHGFEQGENTRNIMIKNGYFDVKTHHDWERRERFTEGFINRG